MGTTAVEDKLIGYHLSVDSRETSIADSAIGIDDTERSSITTSLNSTVRDYRYDHGRRYHAFHENAYYLPNDEQEVDRLDIQDHVWKLTLNGGLHISPIPDTVKNVVDVGTGTGKWCIDFAEAHPNTTVLGTDLSPIQPIHVPVNCSFLTDDAEALWVFDQKFDFIHSRMLLMGVHDWPRYFQQAWDNLAPGGFMEVQEVQFPIAFADDGSVPPDSPVLVWSQHIHSAVAKGGVDTMVTEKFEDLIKAQGFVNVRQEWVKWPLGAWPRGEKEKKIGRWTLENTKQFVSAIALKTWTKYLGWTQEQVEEFLVDVEKDLDDRRKHYYWQMAIFSAQKPPEAA